ncbi:Gp138 family membrane-puncturing spike protein [Methylobacterium sp. WL6]|uniref:Gp138 family membrane-puncturing spike protein n=1 Tax=Methylobacterium sp. WL6 TaxID=2603901 RepID=UPI0011CC43DE|nr:Gp138 family membrane-puncturing spike protein [Methylobacterium sp. WL6]TXN71471.1 hypothetical protein FV230_08410 [Methylobacterium sp. WL6]
MDPRTRYTDELEIYESLADQVRSSVMTAMPVRVIKDADGHTVSIQPTMKAVFRKEDGSLQQVDYPPITDAPIQFSGGGGVTSTHPVKQDDEGIALFMARSMDAWHQQGGTQAQIDARVADLSDAVYIPGIRSTPRKLPKFNPDAHEMRSDDGKHVVSLHPQKGVTVSVDDGKHTLAFDKDTGISMKSGMAIAMESAKGFALKGDLNVKGKVSPSGGLFGSVFQGMAGGAMVLLVALLASQVRAIPEPVQRAAYTLTALVSR